MEYTEGTCVPCSGTGLRDADTVCPTCDGSGGRVPIPEPGETPAATPAPSRSRRESPVAGV